jgi:hypothetical protein
MLCLSLDDTVFKGHMILFLCVLNCYLLLNNLSESRSDRCELFDAFVCDLY